MTTSAVPDTLPGPRTAGGPTSRPALVTRPMLIRFASIAGSSVSFFLPLSVVPLYAKQAGSDGGAGLATAALLLTTVAGELATPRLVAKVGRRCALTAGLLLLGLPLLFLLVSSAMPVILAVSVVRGAGFAVTVVVGSEITAALIPPDRRGEGLALVGLVGGIPALLALPLGVWSSAHWGFGPVFALAAGASVLAVASVPFLPSGTRASTSAEHGMLAALRNPALTVPSLVFAASAAAVGVLVTFVPLATKGLAGWVAPAVLLAQPATSMAARWLAGRFGDARGHARLPAPGIALSVAGMAAMALTGSAAAVLAGAILLGAGFGLLQNATLVLLYSRTPADAHGAAGALWNAAYDVGMGAGALGVGALATPLGYPTAFLLTAVLVLPALLPARRTAR